MAKRGKMTANVKTFLTAREKLGVVSTREKGPDTIFTLRGGREYKLTPPEVRAMAQVAYRWTS